jgi:hypothetical protein
MSLITNSFGLNHYGTSYATGRAVQSGDSRALSFGPSERVYERDGKLIGNRGENGHPHDGEYPSISMISAPLTFMQSLGDSENCSDTLASATSSPTISHSG